MHVGPIKKRRNIDIFEELQKDGNQVIIIGRESQESDTNLYRALKRKGSMVWAHYLKNMEEVYALSDCYIFPASDEYSCIEMPLSVMEAMSCNLPVITTKFRALPRAFDEGDGLLFVEDGKDIYKVMEDIKNGCVEVETRGKVLPHSWENIAKNLEGIYEELLC